VPRLAALLVLPALIAAMAAGCGGGSVETDGSRTGTATDVVPSTSGAGGKAPLGAGAEACDTDAFRAEGLRATGVSCERAHQVLHGWQRESSCSLPAAASRGSCLVRPYRCQAVRVDLGLAVSCARAGQSIAFIARR
jgi:hypothetical protein